ncbi:MAG: carboxypeptidase-like regulatory domain-containing protein [Acidobacteriota bacterium]|nr:carboxypeptidase-like regulatory domain-containing protein [Acidobacteriota bacterium]
MAQATAQISGTVTDPTGAVVPGANVTLKNTGTNATRTFATNSAGLFHFTDLQPGEYLVTAETAGFAPYTSQLEVNVGAHITVDAKLSVGGANTTVEVSTNQSVMVNTQTPEVSEVINQEQISQLPSLTRNPYDFIALAGNITSGDNTASGNVQNGANRGVNFSLNGQRNSGTEILLDGVENLQIFSDAVAVIVPVDTVQEYRVITNNFSPEYGRASGGVVAVATRGGTNAFHGRLWEFNRIAATTANTVTNAQQGIPKGAYTRNQFGGIVGGPIVKDKLFFFASTEFTRVRSAANITAAIPSSQLLAASNSSVSSFFSTYAGPTIGTVIGTTTNSQAGGGTPLFPSLPASLPVFTNLSFTAPADAGGGIPQNTYNVTGRFDYTASQRTQAFFRYVNYHETDQQGAIQASPYSQYDVSGKNYAQAYLLSVAHEFNSALSTIAHASFTRDTVGNGYNTALQNVPTLNLYPNAVDPYTLNTFFTPGFYPTNPANGGLPYGGPQNTVQYNQDVNYTRGKHQLQGGAQILYIQMNQAYGAYAQASEQIGKSAAQAFANFPSGQLYRFTVAANPQGATPCSRNPYTGALVQNAACSITLPATSPSFARSDRYHDWAAYVNDIFKVTPSLSLSYGVRYEYFGVQHNNNPNLDANFYYGTGSNLFAQVRSGSVLTVPNSPIGKLWNPQHGTVSPRIGFAYDVFGNGATAFRAGYGISYERNFGNVTFNVIQNPPNYATIVLTSSACTPTGSTPCASTGAAPIYTVTNNNLGPVSAGSGSVALPPTSLRHVDQNIRTAQTQFWSASIDQKVGYNAVVEIAYNGSRGIHLYDIKNLNIPGEGNLYLGDPLVSGTSKPTLTPVNTHFSNDNQRGSNGDSYYQAVNVQFNARNLRRSGLSLIANYTFSHELDDLSSAFSETSAGNFELGYTDATNPGLDHASGDFDIRHRFVFSPVYQTPWFDKGSALARLLGGYEITGIFSMRTGTPFTFYDSTNNNSGYQVPRYNPATPVTTHSFTKIPAGQNGGGANNYRLTGDTTLPANNPFGNPALLGISDLGPYPSTMTARNAFRGPGAYNLNVSISKAFPIHEHVNLELRAEGFDVTNHHNLYIQESLNDAANYSGNPQIFARKGGINGGASDERRFLQFAGKINF